MKTKHILFATMLSLFTFWSCSTDQDDDVATEPNRVIARFTATISGQVQTKATGTSWAQDDAVGVFMKTSGQNLSSTSIIDNARNKKYKTSGSGNFFPADGNQNVYFPSNGGNVDFIAYYPYQPGLTDFNYKIDLSNQSLQEAIDLLYSDNAKELNNSNPMSSLSFSHQLSKLVFSVTAGSGLTSLEGLKITIAGMKTRAEFSLVDGTLTVDDQSTTDIVLKTLINGTKATSEAIVLPAEGMSGRTITFTLPSGTFKWVVPSKVKYEKGYRYTYDIVLKNKGGEVTPNFGWTETPVVTPLANTIYVSNRLPDKKSIRNFSMLYDTNNKLAYWVAYPMHSSYVGSAKRTDAWGFDPDIQQAWQPRLSKGWGAGTNMDRGHQLPSADRNYSEAGNRTTFYYSNMTAQSSRLNQGMWANLESQVRVWMSQCDTLYVVTGAMIVTKTDKSITYINDNDGKPIAKPKYYYKALAKKVGTSYYTIAFKMNNEVPVITDYNNYRLNVKELEDETGFTFFPSLPDNVKSTIESSKWL